MFFIRENGSIIINIPTVNKAVYLVIINFFEVLKILALLFKYALALHQPGKTSAEYNKRYPKNEVALLFNRKHNQQQKQYKYAQANKGIEVDQFFKLIDLVLCRGRALAIIV